MAAYRTEIGRVTLRAIERHGEESFPRECCGLLLGTRAGATRRIVAMRRARNLAETREHESYVLDPRDRLAAESEAAAAGLELVGFYHSHPDHESYFSATDLAHSEEVQWGEPWVPPTYTYLVLSVQRGSAAVCKAFHVEAGAAVEEPLEVRELASAAQEDRE